MEHVFSREGIYSLGKYAREILKKSHGIMQASDWFRGIYIDKYENSQRF